MELVFSSLSVFIHVVKTGVLNGMSLLSKVLISMLSDPAPVYVRSPRAREEFTLVRFCIPGCLYCEEIRFVCENLARSSRSSCWASKVNRNTNIQPQEHDEANRGPDKHLTVSCGRKTPSKDEHWPFRVIHKNWSDAGVTCPKVAGGLPKTMSFSKFKARCLINNVYILNKICPIGV